MSRGELGSLVFVSFLLVGGFYYAKFSYVNAPDDRALLAQTQTATGVSAPTVSSMTKVDGTCIAGQTVVINIDEKGAHASSSCDPKAANTCKVTVNAPGETVEVNYCCRPADGVCFCRVGNTACPAITTNPATLRPYEAKCAQNNTPLKNGPSGMVSPGSQLAAAAGIIPCDSGKVTNLIAAHSSAAPTSAQNSAPPTSPTSAINPPPPATQIPAAQGTARPEIGNAFSAQPAPAGPQPAQTAPSAYSGIQAEAGRPAPATPGSGTFPAQTAPSGPAFNQAPAYAPGSTPPPGGPLAANYPGYSAPEVPRAQTTFGKTDVPGGYRGGGPRPNNAFVSGLASLISGLFSVPANTIAAYIQSFAGPAQPAQPLPAGPPRAQPQQAVQNIVIVPYTVVPPPSFDINELIIAIGEQPEDAARATTSGATNAGNAAAISPASPAQDGPGLTTRSGIDLFPVGPTGAAAAGKDATSTESTSSLRWKGERVAVEVGVPVDITDPASYESILAYINGDWPHVLRTATQNRAALAQAESERTSIIAHIESLQEAHEAGICDERCASVLSTLQRDLPQWQSRVEALEATVRNDAAPRPAPPPTVAQMSRVAGSLARPGYQVPEAVSPRSPSAAPAVVSVASQEAPPPSGEVKGEAAVLRIVRSIRDFLKSWFLPSPQAQAAKGTCSLFLSLFGKCK